MVADRRGKGTGKALARAFFQWVQEQELLWLTVTAYTAKQGDQAFYRRFGFVPHTIAREHRLV